MGNVAEMIISGVMVGATAVTGGASAGSNQTVVTGDSSASVQVTNVINGDSEGGSSHTIIEKTVNGITTREEETKEYEPGEAIKVNVSAEAKSGGQQTTNTESATADSHVQVAAEVTYDASTTTEEATSTDVLSSSFVHTIGSYMKQTIATIVSGFLNLWN